MNSKCIFVILRRTLLIVLVLIMFLATTKVFERKTVTGAWNYSIKVGGFKNEPQNSFDIIGFGSSHMYCTFSPVYLYEQTGLRSYVLATQQQPIDATYHYIKEALKTQKPDVLILEAFMLINLQDAVPEGVAHDAIDPFPESVNKLQMINRLNIDGSKESYYLNFMKYHTRWKELTYRDYDFSYKKETDPFHGFVFLTQTVKNTCVKVSYDNVAETPLKSGVTDTLLKIKELADENNIKLLLMVAPHVVIDAEYGLLKYLHSFAKENNIDILDLNKDFDNTNIDNDTDFYGSGHLNVYGAEKATMYIKNYISEKCKVEPEKVNDDKLWREDMEYYNSLK